LKRLAANVGLQRQSGDDLPYFQLTPEKPNVPKITSVKMAVPEIRIVQLATGKAAVGKFSISKIRAVEDRIREITVNKCRVSGIEIIETTAAKIMPLKFLPSKR
jgi:hypothetical protein